MEISGELLLKGSLYGHSLGQHCGRISQWNVKEEPLGVTSKGSLVGRPLGVNPEGIPSTFFVSNLPGPQNTGLEMDYVHLKC